MKTKLSPAVVGAFVIGAFALGVLSLVAFGSLSLFSHPQRFVVYFGESVHGLDPGAAVNLRGVRVGRVVDLSIRYDRVQNQSVAAVVCELNGDRITDNNGAVINVSDRAALQELVDRGLRAQLGVGGLATGLLFVELDFLDPRLYPDPASSNQLKYVVVPSIRSQIAELQTGISTLLAKMQAIDFAGLSVELKRLIVAVRVGIEGVDVKGLVQQWRTTGQSVDALARSPELARTLRNLDATTVALRSALARLDTQVDANGKDLQVVLAQTRETLQSFNAAAITVRRFVDSQQNLGQDADRAFARLADAAESIQRLADFLERNPNALISGKKAP
jgi:paraquat-inducible protein B